MCMSSVRRIFSGYGQRDRGIDLYVDPYLQISMNNPSTVQLVQRFDQFGGIEPNHGLVKMTSIADVLEQIAIRTVGQTKI